MFSNDEFLRALGPRLPDSVRVSAVGTPLSDSARVAISRQIMNAHPGQIGQYLEYTRQRLANEPRSRPAGPANRVARALVQASIVAPAVGGFGCFHLIYAYLLENTRMYELFGRVLQAYNDGETLGVATTGTRTWLTGTEAAFYRQQTAHDHLTGPTLTSDRRDDGRGIRRNAYYRMFGMDLNHGTDDNKPYPYVKPKASNRDFVATLEDLLRQVWIAIVNDGTTTANPTDDAEIEQLARRLRVMLNNRRLQGTLAREEFSAVATLDWLRLAVTFDSDVVNDLRANAASESERLKKIAERVGLPAHGRSDDYFELASPMSGLLQGIENGTLSDRATLLNYTPIDSIINHWSRATGKVLKKMPRPVVSGVQAA
jgi:hypothetical protein